MGSPPVVEDDDDEPVGTDELECDMRMVVVRSNEISVSIPPTLLISFFFFSTGQIRRTG